ncbi:protein-S-isoprenylcysteine methyltransferase [Marinobacter santoriniensis NKSG1]|uniref:Protein-S-isoprenylcysteine methyltransferase n=1 Tax=Marinobacter santoriniensis NKSG1 TaxID=1288826 RepID=M7CYU6_9GAMM|nr:isoprenylcysteine carboxylmethyltransferase family protein [Marinobacter santoriniensis]EMP57410.1 protein-S-isoprenylcysteine methyltransferase [Marinobacter santoriniensis NKSG1]
MLLIEPLVRHFLGIFFLMIGLQFAGRTLGLYARLQFSHINYGVRGSAPWWHRHTFNVFRAAILGVCMARIFVDIDSWLGVFNSLYQGWILLVGMVLLLASYSAVNYLQAYMHEEWRSGIDSHGDRQKLLTSGPFARSRNPLFLAVMTGQLGFFLALPSVFSLVCLVVGVAVIMRQAREEEKALARQFGKAYDDYRARVRRWF